MSLCCGEEIINRKPRILITFRIGGENGGPYVSHKRIVESCLKDKYDFIPLMLPKPREMLTISGMRELIGQIKRADADILHFAGLQLEGFAVLLVAKFAGMKNTLCTIRGSSIDAMGFPKYKKIVMVILENWTLKHSKACYGVSEFVSNWLRVKKYAKINFGYVYNMGLNLSDQNTKESTSTIREELGIGANEIIVVSTGRIVIDKGFDVLLKIITCGKKWSNVRFLIVGNGNFVSKMQEKINSSHLKEKVLFLGYRSDVKSILYESDIFVICTYHETLCNSVIEASGAGLPVVATRVGGIPEIIKDKETGFLFGSGNATEATEYLEKLIDNKELRKEMGAKGKRRVCEKFSEKIITEKLSDIYDSMLMK